MNSVQNSKKSQANRQLSENKIELVQQGNEKKQRVNEAVEANKIDVNFSLASRELTAMPTVETVYSKEVNEAIKLRIEANIVIVNEVFAKHKKTLIKYSVDDSMGELAAKTMEGYFRICDYGLKPSYDKIILSLSNAKEKVKSPNNNLEAYVNGSFCWSILQKMFECEHNGFPELKINKEVHKNDRIVKGVDLVINETIIGFKSIREEFFSVLRKLLDPNLTIEAKRSIMYELNPAAKLILSLLNCGHPNSLQGQLDNLFSVAKVVAEGLSQDIFRLQKLVECLNKFKCAPKTLENCRQAYSLLKNCYDEHYKMIVNQFNLESPYIDSRLKIKKLFHGLLMNMIRPINEATTVNNLFMETQNRLDSQNKKAVQKKLSTQKTRNKKLATQGHAINNKSRSEIKNLSEKENVSIQNDAKPESVVILEKTNDKKIAEQHEEGKKEITISDIQREVKILEIGHNTVKEVIDYVIVEEAFDSDSLDDVEIETNELMEALRRYYDKDRVEKLKLKEEKLKKSKIIFEKKKGTEVLNSSNQISPSIQILSDKKQILVKNLFRKPLPEYRIILGKKVQSLITQLGGKSQGNKGNFEIHWNGSNKKAGDYEICHEGDTKGYLTPNYAKRVADAIYAGVISYGTISKGYFTPELLNMIENHEIDNDGK